eukprot:1816712-Prymnesium_polylepis.1
MARCCACSAAAAYPSARWQRGCWCCASAGCSCPPSRAPSLASAASAPHWRYGARPRCTAPEHSAARGMPRTRLRRATRAVSVVCGARRGQPCHARAASPVALVSSSLLCVCSVRRARARAQVGVWAEWAAVGLAAAAHLSFFVPAVAAISAALGIHPFRVRGAAH